MNRATIAAVAFCLVAACDKRGEDMNDQAKQAGPALAPGTAAKPPSISSPSFAGTYRSTWGDTVFVHTGEAVSATYPGGTLSCAVKEGALDCTWKEGASTGKAHLTRKPDGTIEGTWGNGASDKDGGQWTFVPKK